MSRWLTVTALANRKAELSLRGVIGVPKMWEQYGANAAGTAKDFEKELKALGDVEEITLRIYSPGGYVFEGLAIHDILANHPARITVQIDGLCASIATVIMLAADKIVMPSNAYVMIHNAQGIEMGDYRTMAKMAADLEKWSADIAKMYAGKIKSVKGEASMKTLNEMRAMMDAETWLTGTDAKALGLVDEVTNEVALSASIAPLAMALNLPVNMDRVPAAVRAAFDTTTPSPSEDPSMKLQPAPLLNAASLTPPAGGGAAPAAQTQPAPAAPVPTAQAPAPAAPPAPSVPPTQPTAALTQADITAAVSAAVTAAVEPLTKRITALEGLRAAGVSPTAWGNQPPVEQPSASIDAPKTAEDVRNLLAKAKNFQEKRQILAAAQKAGIPL